MRRLAIAAILCASALPAFAAAPANAPQKVVPITNASEATMLFRRLCVETLGDINETTKTIEPFIQGGVAKKLPKDTSKQFTGHDSQATWVLVSPKTQQKLMVDYDSKNVCAVYVNRASPSEMRDAFRRVVGFLAASVKGKVATKSEPKKIGDNTIQFDFYEIILPGDKPRIALALSTSDTAVGDTQHYMTYATLPTKKK